MYILAFLNENPNKMTKTELFAPQPYISTRSSWPGGFRPCRSRSSSWSTTSAGRRPSGTWTLEAGSSKKNTTDLNPDCFSSRMSFVGKRLKLLKFSYWTQNRVWADFRLWKRLKIARIEICFLSHRRYRIIKIFV